MPPPCALALVSLAPPVHAQNWPTQPIRIVVGFPPGGMADALPRKMQDALTAALGQPVVVENKPGGAESIAVLAVTQAKATTRSASSRCRTRRCPRSIRKRRTTSAGTCRVSC